MRFNRRNEIDEYRATDGVSIIEPPRLLPHLVILTMFIGGSLGAVHYVAGPPTFNSVLLSLASPTGVIWAFLFLAAYWVTMWRIRLAALLCWTSWLLLTMAGSSFTANKLITSLERPYLQIDPFQLEKFDAILVLGGGSDTTPAGVPQLAAVGDRLALAARLFHAGKVDKILVSGLRRGDLQEKELQLYEESARILIELHVPEASIVQLKLGTDTSEEIKGLKTWLGEKSPIRVGLLTSAWHLRRATMLAERNQVASIPVPANFLSENIRPGPGMLIPSGANMLISQLGLKEYLGLWLDK